MKRKLIIATPLIILVIVTIVYFMKNTASLQQEAFPSWKNIILGQTTQEQVISLLGQPHEIGISGGETYYNFLVPGSKSHVNRVFFRNQIFRPVVVSWLDVENGVDRNNPYIIHQAMLNYGSLDSAAQRMFVDVGSTELIYVWARHGIALLAVPAYWLKMELPEEIEADCKFIGQVPQRYFINDVGGYLNHSNACDVVVREVIFQPMGFKEFWSKYGYKISRIDGVPEHYFKSIP